MKKEIKISEENALNAYDNASAEGKELLEHLLGKEVFMQKDITERIKTFDDALQELSRRAEACDDDAATLLADYESNEMNIENPQTVAYMKLTIIVNALNEGWVPQFTKDEVRYYPYYWLYTKEEVDAMDDDQRSRLLCVGGSATYGSLCGLSASNAHHAFSSSYAILGARLAFKTRELALYAARQFVDIWADYIFSTKNR